MNGLEAFLFGVVVALGVLSAVSLIIAWYLGD